jgi:hypothetical protein
MVDRVDLSIDHQGEGNALSVFMCVFFAADNMDCRPYCGFGLHHRFLETCAGTRDNLSSGFGPDNRLGACSNGIDFPTAVALASPEPTGF